MVPVNKEHSRLKNISRNRRLSLFLLKCANADVLTWVNPTRALELGEYKARRQPIGNYRSCIDIAGTSVVNAP